MKQLYITLLLLLSISTNAQYVDLEYTLFDSSNGFVDDEISALYTDSNGTIWIGTYSNGIYTYANEEFTHYDEDENEFLTGRPSVFLEADNGDMWIGFYHEAYGGVMKFDGTTFTAEHTVSDQVSIGRVVDLLINEEGNLCILECYNSYHPYTLNIVEQDTIFAYPMGDTYDSPGGIGNMIEAPDGRLWLVSRGALFIYDDGELLGDSLLNIPFSTFDATHIEIDNDDNIWLARWDENLIITDPDGTFWTFFDLEWGDQTHQEVLPGKQVGPLYKDMAGNMWFITKRDIGDEMYLCRFSNGRLVNYHLTSHSAPYETPFDMDAYKYFSNPITEDVDQNLWIGLETLGLVRLENVSPADIPTPENLPTLRDTLVVIPQAVNTVDRPTYEFTTYGDTQGFTNNVVMSIFMDSQDRLWIGNTAAGVYSFKNDTFTHYKYFSNTYYDYNEFRGWFTDFAEDTEGNILIAVADTVLGGVYEFNGEKIHLKHVRGNQSLKHSYTNSLLLDDDNNLYVGGSSLYPIHSSVSKFASDTTMIFGDLGNGIIWDIAKNPAGGVGVIGSAYYEINEEGEITEYEVPFEDFDDDNLRALIYGDGHDVWIADNYEGLRYLDYDSGWGIQAWTDDGAKYLFQDKDGQAWYLSNQNKLYRINDGELDIDQIYGIGGNAFAGHRTVMIHDHENIYWSGLNSGISRIVLEIEETSTNNIENTLQLSVYPNPVSQGLNIESSIVGSLSYEIYNEFGQLIKSDQIQENKIRLTELKTGQYHLKIYSDNGFNTFKIMKY